MAIKQIPKAMSASLTREIHHHRQLHHPNVTQLYEVIATETSIWLVTELCTGGELFDYLAEKGRLGEDEVRVLFGQLCLAVAYVHDKGIVHRDLKLENVLLDEKCRVKLGDFGFTREFDKNSLLETYCGTTGYASPEMLLNRKYTGPGEYHRSMETVRGAFEPIYRNWNNPMYWICAKAIPEVVSVAKLWLALGLLKAHASLHDMLSLSACCVEVETVAELRRVPLISCFPLLIRRGKRGMVVFVTMLYALL